MLTTSTALPLPVLPRLMLEKYAPRGSGRRIFLNTMRRHAIIARIRTQLFFIRQAQQARHPLPFLNFFRVLVHRVWDLVYDYRYGRLPKVIENPFDLDLQNRFLRRCGLPILEADPAQASASETGAARYILARFLTDAALREEFPHGLTEGAEGGLCLRLCDEFKDKVDAAEHIRAAFARKLSARPWQAFDHYIDWREAMPLALTPAGTRDFEDFLLRTARQPVGLSVEEILWFMLELADDPTKGIRATYLRTPSWQHRHPNGLTRQGLSGLLEWVAKEYYQKDTAWMEKLPVPNIYNSDQVRRLNRLVGSEKRSLRPAMLPPIGANVLAHFRYSSGLQEAALNTVKALQAAELPHTLRDVPVAMSLDQPGRENLLGQELYDVSILHLAPIPNPAIHYPKTGLWIRPNVHRVGVWYWELQVIPEDWPTHARELNEIWAPTRFIYRAMDQVMPVPVIPMLPGVPTPVAPDLPRSRFGLDPDKFLFLYLFDMNSVMERKNPLALIEAYRRAFGQSKGTQLAIKVSRGHVDPDSYAQLTRAMEEVGGVLINSVMSREECYGLMNCCDAYVSLHRSEGFGLTIAEAMLLGKPVVATGYSGNLDFTSGENSCLIPYETVPITHECTVYPKGGMWADPSVEEAAEAMRWIVEDRDGSAAMARRGKADALRTLSLKAYGERIRNRLEELAGSEGHSFRKAA